MRILFATALIVTSLVVILGLTPTPVPSSQSAAVHAVLFDDFSYSNKEQMKKNGWILRTEPGWPGILGATWKEDGISLLKDPDQRDTLLVRMTSSTDGTSANTTQTQFCHQRKYLEGTYAARVRFTDKPISGPGGDQLVHAEGDVAGGGMPLG